MKKATILGIETSCDETAAAVVEDGRTVLSNVISSQIEIHRRFGGVVPEVASRNHCLAINTVIAEALEKAERTIDDIDAVAVTTGAGLIGALLVGITAAKAIAFSKNIPLIEVNHLEGHIIGATLSPPPHPPPPIAPPSPLPPPLSPSPSFFPSLALIASGGHTGLIRANSPTEYENIGGTVDDAIGEAFDKVARVLGLPYPGGPEIERHSKNGTANINFYKNQKKKVAKDLKLSYSGLKTAVINYINTKKQKNEPINIADICASFTVNAIDILVNTAIFAAQNHSINTILLGGGVAANSYLREKLENEAQKADIKVIAADRAFCTDNAAMIAARGYYDL